MCFSLRFAVNSILKNTFWRNIPTKPEDLLHAFKSLRFSKNFVQKFFISIHNIIYPNAFYGRSMYEKVIQ